jgi:hypothetical protein|tara:strand:+ start:506 stop:619 length:114 start_codon:yes stop_codon:yes gene_type:complete
MTIAEEEGTQVHQPEEGGESTESGDTPADDSTPEDSA